MRKNLLLGTKPTQYHTYVNEGTLAWTELLLRRVKEELQSIPGAPISLLDVGMGTGHLLIALMAARLPKRCRYFGVDIDPKMVRFAKAQVRRMDCRARPSLQVGDVHDLPFENNSIDLVIGRSVVHHWADPVLAFREIGRVLAKGGRLLIHEPLRNPRTKALAAFNNNRCACGLPVMSLKEKYTIAEITRQLKSAGMARGFRVQRGTGIASLGCEIHFQKGD